MKDDTKNLLMIGGGVLAAWYFLGKQTTATTQEGGGTTTLLGQDLSWLSNLIPQNGIGGGGGGLPNINIGGEEGGGVTDIVQTLIDTFNGIVKNLIPGGGGGGDKTTTTEGTPNVNTPLPTNAPGSTSQTGLTLGSSWGDIIKGWILNTTPGTANLGTKIALITGGVSVIGGGVAAAKYLGPGVAKVSTGLGGRIAEWIGTWGKKGGGAAGGLGLAMLPPGALTPEAFGIGGPQPTVSFWDALTGKTSWSQFWGETGEAAAFQITGFMGLGGNAPVANRSMKTGVAPSLVTGAKLGAQGVAYIYEGAYDASGYNAQSALSGVKPVGGAGQAISAPSQAAMIKAAQLYISTGRMS